MFKLKKGLGQRRAHNKTVRPNRRRKAAVMVLAAFLTVAMMSMLAFSIDLGYILSVQGEMDRAVDAAALAGAGSLVDGTDVANLAALDVLLRNPIGLQLMVEDEDREQKLQAWLAQHPDEFDTEAGNWDPETRTFSETDGPPSAMKVSAVYHHPNLFFARVLGFNDFTVQAEAIARYQPRDIALVLDFSGSMNDDSELKRIYEYGEGSRETIETGLATIYEELGSPTIGNMGFEPVYVESTYNPTIKTALGLDGVPYPYPSGSWDDYINYVKSSYNSPGKAGYQKKYGYLTLINYWLEKRPSASQTPDLWQVSAQPITAVKDTVSVFMDYIQEVDCDDRMGLVVYNSPSQDALIEESLTGDFDLVRNLVQHRQAGHYDSYTNIGAGIRKGWEELDANGRIGAKKMIVLMTDGIANKPYNTSYAKQYALDQAAQAAQRGYQIVTISLGNGADKELMQQIADVTHGAHFNIPGDSSVSDYEDELLAVFRKIADARPLLLVR